MESVEITMAEQFLKVNDELINMRDIHRIKKDCPAHVNSIAVVFRHLKIMQIKFSTLVGRNAEFNFIMKEIKEHQPIIEVRGGTIEEESYHA